MQKDLAKYKCPNECNRAKGEAGLKNNNRNLVLRKLCVSYSRIDKNSTLVECKSHENLIALHCGLCTLHRHILHTIPMTP